MQRNNQEWLEDLRGLHGAARLTAAHEDLAAYLYRVAYTHLQMRQSNTPLLNSLGTEGITELARDLVQQTLEKTVRNDFALLDRYAGRGSFTGYMATIILNEARQELRLCVWRTTTSVDFQAESTDGDEDGQRAPAAQWAAQGSTEATVIRSQTLLDVESQLRRCVAAMPEMRRSVFLAVSEGGVEGDSQKVKEVAANLGISQNAVSLHLWQARQNLRACLENAGIDRDVLTIFAD